MIFSLIDFIYLYFSERLDETENIKLNGNSHCKKLQLEELEREFSKKQKKNFFSKYFFEELKKMEKNFEHPIKLFLKKIRYEKRLKLSKQ